MKQICQEKVKVVFEIFTLLLVLLVNDSCDC